MRFNGASGKEKKYHKHKDSYIHDPNNEIEGMKLRKLTMIVFMNDGQDVENPDTPKSQLGSFRLYPEGDNIDNVIDVVPRKGRAVIFKSEKLLHKVTPVLG